MYDLCFRLRAICVAGRALLLVATLFSPCFAQAYDYPIDNPYVATVLGTPVEFSADLPVDVPGEARTLDIAHGSEIPEVFWYERGLKFGFAPQPRRAPLVFIIAGTGSHYKGETIITLGRALYGAGFHVISISSPTQLNFLVNASRSHLPGMPSSDVADLYDVMLAAYESVRDEIEVSEFHLTGYSLGGSHAAFLAKLDEERGAFDFKRVLMINPAVNLYNSARIFDQLLEDAIPGGARGVGKFLDGVIRDLAVLYRETDVLRLDGEFVYSVYEQTKSRFPPAADAREIQVAQALIAIAFRIASANMVFGADVMNGSGYIVPRNAALGKYDSLTTYARASHAVRFTEYADDLVIPALMASNPGTTREEILRTVSLLAIEGYLASAEHIGVVTNEDEIILGPGELDYLKQVFGTRIKTYPRGGHCGNIAHRDNVKFMIEFFTGQGQEDAR